MKALVKLAVSLALVPWHGYVASALWSWFVVPLGVRPVSVFHACGLVLVAHVFAVPENVKREDRGWGTSFALGLLVPLIFLGLGALCHWAAS